MAAFSRPNHRGALTLVLTGSLLIPLVRGSAQEPQATAEEANAAELSKSMKEVKALPECSITKTNMDCRLIINREKPLSPPAVQMYSNQRITVVIKRPKVYERYFLDYQSGQATLSPDVASSIVQGMLPSLAKVGEIHGFDLIEGVRSEADVCSASEITATAIPAAGSVKNVVSAVWKCLAQLSGKAINIYHSLEPFVAPDSLISNASQSDPSKTDMEKLVAIKQPISDFLKLEFAISSRISSIAGDSGLKATPDTGVRAADARAILELTDLQKSADAVATDLLGYRLRIADLQGYENGFQDCGGVLDLTKDDKNDPRPPACIWITAIPDDASAYNNMVTRTVTYSLDSLNLVSNSRQGVPDPSKKKLLATVALNFADTPKRIPGMPRAAFRWEASAGAFFSSLAIRSFSVTPVFTDGAVTNKIISENALYPTVVPFAGANYRLTNDLAWSRWKSNVYWTGAIGINPNTVSADFGTGPSVSWRALMVSALCHFGHDVRLTQGLTVNQNLGASFSGTLSTENYWTESFAVGLSVRVPALTGR
jgi:hypothetical protein